MHATNETEADTRANRIDPVLRDAGWGVVEGALIQRELICPGRFMDQIDQREKTLVFWATQDHAARVRNYINQVKTNPDPHYCERVTADDGEHGERHLREFQDNEKSLPTIMTTPQNLSTGVDELNIRNIVLLRPIKSMIEFKQIIGRGTRTFDARRAGSRTSCASDTAA